VKAFRIRGETGAGVRVTAIVVADTSHPPTNLAGLEILKAMYPMDRVRFCHDIVELEWEGSLE